jgi:aryl-alcohol dehydrogenase-like predicted oxidoreductase
VYRLATKTKRLEDSGLGVPVLGLGAMTFGEADQNSEELGVEPSAVALAWLLHQPAVSSVIFGARTVAQLEANARAAEVELSDAMLARLGEASPPELGDP